MVTQLLRSMGMAWKVMSRVLPSAAISWVATGLPLTMDSTVTLRVAAMRAVARFQEPAPAPKPLRSLGLLAGCSGRRAATFTLALILDGLVNLISLPSSPPLV